MCAPTSTMYVHTCAVHACMRACIRGVRLHIRIPALRACVCVDADRDHATQDRNKPRPHAQPPQARRDELGTPLCHVGHICHTYEFVLRFCMHADRSGLICHNSLLLAMHGHQLWQCTYSGDGEVAAGVVGGYRLYGADRRGVRQSEGHEQHQLHKTIQKSRWGRNKPKSQTGWKEKTNYANVPKILCKDENKKCGKLRR